MNRICNLLIVTCVLSSIPCFAAGPIDTTVVDITVMSYNIRYDNPGDGADAWANRKSDVASLILAHDLHILGVQEALHHQLEYLDSALADYAWVGVGRDDGITAGEFTAIFYDSVRLNLVDHETIWCSETPEKPGFGWDAVCNRTITHAEFQLQSSDRRLHILNTHWDHVGTTARIESARQLRKKAGSVAENDYVVALGDLNCIPGTPPYELLTDSTQRSVLHDAALMNAFQDRRGTYNGFNHQAETGPRIDYVLTKSNVRVLSYEVLYSQIEGRYPSDHFPVKTVVQLYY